MCRSRFDVTRKFSLRWMLGGAPSVYQPAAVERKTAAVD
jgi:hypothetical protein